MEKTAKISEETLKSLAFQKLNENLSSIEETIKQNIDFSKKFDNEPKFAKWFENHYGLLGFEGIIKKNTKGCPDYIMMKNGEKIRVELETLSSRFLIHKHNPADVDLVLCLRKNKELPVKTIEVDLFQYGKEKEYTQMQIKKSVLKKLGNLKIHPQQSYSEVIEILLKSCSAKQEIK